MCRRVVLLLLILEVTENFALKVSSEGRVVFFAGDSSRRYVAICLQRVDCVVF